ncbi:hypothetical protein CUS_6353 [Ruminococcus albus 8]|uniref:Uncharacterized protein n=1 Tax=Ruminococcus albus 8 TaxID=246199 RepID=E9SGD4_RUMAL|nr:hypothetical protein CUS_6353 [Ruminococcus albus 8]
MHIKMSFLHKKSVNESFVHARSFENCSLKRHSIVHVNNYEL